jgi:hypothetical protein
MTTFTSVLHPRSRYKRFPAISLFVLIKYITYTVLALDVYYLRFVIIIFNRYSHKPSDVSDFGLLSYAAHHLISMIFRYWESLINRPWLTGTIY